MHIHIHTHIHTLQFPCGRMVQLCLSCAQAFSDLLATRYVCVFVWPYVCIVIMDERFQQFYGSQACACMTACMYVCVCVYGYHVRKLSEILKPPGMYMCMYNCMYVCMSCDLIAARYICIRACSNTYIHTHIHMIGQDKQRRAIYIHTNKQKYINMRKLHTNK
jgi:hypothetical protein